MNSIQGKYQINLKKGSIEAENSGKCAHLLKLGKDFISSNIVNFMLCVRLGSGQNHERTFYTISRSLYSNISKYTTGLV